MPTNTPEVGLTPDWTPEATARRIDRNGNPVLNLILSSLSDAQFQSIENQLQFVALPTGMILHEAGEALDYAYFLNGGLCSLVVVTSQGDTVEVGVVGKEGMVGTVLAVGLNQSPHRAVMQVADSGFRMHGRDLQSIMTADGELFQRINKYAQVLGLSVAQTAACNRLHEIEQRLSRWLLTSQDRIGTESLSMTHEFLAQMLGTGRPSVTLAAGMLQRAGLIDYRRGKVRIVDRKGLESAACECYENMRDFQRELGLS